MAQPELPRDDAEEPGDRTSGVSPRNPTALDRLVAALPGKKTRVDLTRRLLVPLLVAAAPLFWVVDATYRASLTTLGRDQGIFQYIAWAVKNGDVDYRDVRDVNGPLVHLIHMIMLALGGRDEHRFHVLDITATFVTFAVVGWYLPGLLGRSRPRALERAAWAIAAAVILGVQYDQYLYWDMAQRESFCDWFLLPSLALQIAAPAPTREGAGRRVMAIAALSTITWFGKPNFALFTIVQLAVLLADREVRLGFRAKLARFVVGGALGAAVPLLYLVRYGDPLAFLRITLVDVPQIYRFIWAKSAPELLGSEGPLGAATLGLATSALLVTLVALRELPRRLLALALAPVAALLGMIAQHKGFGYHFHPLTATTSAGWLVVVAVMWERFRNAPRARPVGRYVAIGLAAALTVERASGMKASPHERNVWILAGGETGYDRGLPEYFETFRTYDFFPWEMRLAARYLADRTSENARVQVYGMDPYVLFLAARKSATPYIYAYDLNCDAALDGGFRNRPTEAQKKAIRGSRDAHEMDMLARLEKDPPEAFVLIDASPLITYQDAWEDMRYTSPKTARWFATNYHPAKSFGPFHVWLRDGTTVPDIETYP